MALQAILCYDYIQQRSPALLEQPGPWPDLQRSSSMGTVPPTTRDKLPRELRDLRTSELLRRAASELATDPAEQAKRASHSELARELEVRALWIERARGDASISRERRRGIAAIEDVERQDTAGRSGRLRCTVGQPCDFHRDGGAPSEPCPGQCDAPGCTLDGYYEVGSDHIVCAAHGAIVLLARAVTEALATDNSDD